MLGIKPILAVMEGKVALAGKAVSYTHLDVYKRQMLHQNKSP